MGRLTNTAPNRLHQSSLDATISPEPLIGLISLETDDGTIELAVNRESATLLIAVLTEFLSGE